jgi:hypothetical protein
VVMRGAASVTVTDSFISPVVSVKVESLRLSYLQRHRVDPAGVESSDPGADFVGARRNCRGK